MLQFAFTSILYWLNFGILIGAKCVDLWSVLYFYIFLLFYVYPVGHSFYDILFRNKIPLEKSFSVFIKLMLAVPLIAAVNFLFGISFSANLTLLLLSFSYILYSNRTRLSTGALLSRITLAVRSINIGNDKAPLFFVVLFSALSTIVSLNSFRIFNYFPDHVSVFGHPSDGSSYYAILSSFVNHTGSFIHGFKITLFSGPNLPAFRFIFEIFESVFVKFSGADIVLFQSVIISQSLMLLLFCIAFLPSLQPNSLENTETENPWNSIFLGMTIVIIYSYFRQISLLSYSMAAFHSFFSWMCILSAIKIFLSTDKFLNNKINAHLQMNIALVFILLLIGVMIHVVYNIIFFIAFLIYLLYRWFNEKQKKYFVNVSISFIILSVALAIFLRNHAGFGEWRISIYNFSANLADIQRYFNDLSFLKPLYAMVLPLIGSNTIGGNIIGSFYALFCFFGYFSIVPFYYFFFTKSRFKFFFGCMLAGIYLVLLIISYQVSTRPSFLAMYMPNVTMLVTTLMVMELAQTNHYIQFQRTHSLFKIGLISSLAAVVLFFNTIAFAKPQLKLDISNNLYNVIMYMKKNTPDSSVILHNIKNSSYYAYFSGFAYRRSVMERGAYAYVYIGNADEIIGDLDRFCKNTDTAGRVRILDKYQVTHVLSSPDCPLDLRGEQFRPVFSNSEYTLYQYSK